jgi:hypothetical protein
LISRLPVAGEHVTLHLDPYQTQWIKLDE